MALNGLELNRLRLPPVWTGASTAIVANSAFTQIPAWTLNAKC